MMLCNKAEEHSQLQVRQIVDMIQEALSIHGSHGSCFTGFRHYFVVR
jgi:hypothetical protein